MVGEVAAMGGGVPPRDLIIGGPGGGAGTSGATIGLSIIEPSGPCSLAI